MSASSRRISGADPQALVERGLLTGCAAAAALTLHLVWQSRSWPLFHDAPLMHYIAWLIERGGVPYRDAFDMNLPGVYAIHWAVLRVLGAGDVAWRVFDLGWLAGTGFLLWAYCRPVGGVTAGAGAAILFALYHVAGGAWRTGQRDFLMCAPILVGAWGLARSWERGGARAPLVWSGLAIGAAMTMKPSAALLLAAGMLVGAAARRGAPGGPLAGATAVLAGGLVAPALVVGWLAWRGGLGPFVAIFRDYVLPLYSRAGRHSLRDLVTVAQFAHGVTIFCLFGGLAALGVAAAWRTPGAPRVGIALGGAAYGVVHYLGQGKGWEYHFYPLAVFLCAVAGSALAGPAASRGARASARDLLRPLAAVALAGAVVVVLHTKAVEVMQSPVVTTMVRRVTSLSRELVTIVPAGERVQVMDTTGGGIHALFRLGIREPTRFIYDFHFFHHTDDPRILALRREFAAGLEAAPPAAIVIFRNDWLRNRYDRIDELPAVASLLERRYTLAVEGDGYRIHAKRSGS
ncbi:MAG: glycosyltransferase family 39 protein [Candidatus Rokuibacteriota bacterium]